MSRPAEHIAVDLCRDLEILTCLVEDLARRTPEGGALAESLTLLHEEWGGIARELMASAWPRPKLHPVQVAFLRGRAADLAETLAQERYAAVQEWVLPEGNGAYARTLVRNLDLTLGRTEALRVALAAMPAAGKPGFELRLDSQLAGDLVDNSELRTSDEPEPELTGAAVRPGRQALRLVDLVIRILPPDQRARYGEEFRAELYGLAEKRLPYGAQLFYVLKQFNRAFELRHELRRSARRSVQP